MNNYEMNEISTKWIESLVVDEINMEESGIVHFNDHIDPGLNLEDSSIDIVEELRSKFEVFIYKFNQLRSDPNKEIKIFKISETINDFLLFRNSLKLIVSRISNEIIRIGFMNNSGNFFSTRNVQGVDSNPVFHEIHAHLGAFNKVTWRYKDDEVDLDAVVKFYLSEFIKQSAN